MLSWQERGRVLVIEDDLLQAQSTTTILREAGYNVIGPYSNLGQAWNALSGQTIACVLLDLDLGLGPEFEAARQVLDSGARLLLVTGYSAEALPRDLAAVARVEKPFMGATLLAELRLCLATPPAAVYHGPVGGSQPQRSC